MALPRHRQCRRRIRHLGAQANQGPAGGTITLNGGTFSQTTTAANAWKVWTGVLTIGAAGGTINVNNTNTTNNNVFFDAGIAGTGALTLNTTGGGNNGLVFRAGVGSYSGALQANSGNVFVNGAAGLVFQNSDVTLGSAATLRLDANWSGSVANASVKSLSGTGNVTLGAQTLTLGTNNGTGVHSGVISGTGRSDQYRHRNPDPRRRQHLHRHDHGCGGNAARQWLACRLGGDSQWRQHARRHRHHGRSGDHRERRYAGCRAGGRHGGNADHGGADAQCRQPAQLRPRSARCRWRSDNDLVQVNGNLTLGGVVNVNAASSIFANTLLPGSYRLINYTGTLSGSTAIGSIPAVLRRARSRPSSPARSTSSPFKMAFPCSSGTAPTHRQRLLNGGTGTWNNGAGNWTDTSGAINQSWIPGVGIFTGVAGVVTIAQPVSAMGLQFITDGYQVTSAGSALTMIGRPDGSMPFIRVDPGATVDIGAEIAGTAGLLKADAGTLILSGANTYSGGT